MVRGKIPALIANFLVIWNEMNLKFRPKEIELFFNINCFFGIIICFLLLWGKKVFYYKEKLFIAIHVSIHY